MDFYSFLYGAAVILINTVVIAGMLRLLLRNTQREKGRFYRLFLLLALSAKGVTLLFLTYLGLSFFSFEAIPLFLGSCFGLTLVSIVLCFMEKHRKIAIK